MVVIPEELDGEQHLGREAAVHGSCHQHDAVV